MAMNINGSLLLSKVLFDFDAATEVEIDLRVDDVVEVFNRDDETGWWEGQVRGGNGKRGLFPAAYVEILEQQQKVEDAYGGGVATDLRRQFGGGAGGGQWGNMNGTLTRQQAMGLRGAMTGNKGPPPGGPPPGGPPPGGPSPGGGFGGPPPGGPPPGRAASPSNVQLQGNFANSAMTNNVMENTTKVANESAYSQSDRGKPEMAQPLTADTAANSNTRFGVYATNMACLSALMMLLTGVGDALWFLMAPERGILYIALGGSMVVTAFAIYLFEMNAGQYRHPNSKLPYRGILYLLMSGPMYMTTPTMFAGGCLTLSGVVNIISFWKKETYNPPPKRSAAQKKAADAVINKNVGICGRLKRYIGGKKEDDQLGRIVFISVYIAINIAFTTYQVLKAKTSIEKLDINNRMSYWILPARAFGVLLDVNVSFLVLPVSRSAIRFMYDYVTTGHTCGSKFWRAIFYFIPLDHALDFHILLGWLVFIFGLAHTVFHLLNYVYHPSNVWDQYGIAPWITGGVLLLCYIIMYPAVIRNVKSGHFEIFWTTHHMFPIFLGSCIIHGKGWFGPNFWYWFIGPGLFYAVERTFREIGSRKPVTLLSCVHMDKVFVLELARSGPFAKEMKEGQYCFIMCPYISKSEWHPFTISSAPQEESVTFHIRMQGKGSWTRELQEYLKLMSPVRNGAYCKFMTNQGTEQVQGKVFGPDTNPIFRIHGPLSAPTQHLPEYCADMIIGSGIGVTPLCASLNSIVHHRWRLFVGKAYPDDATFWWVCAYQDIDSFRWFLRVIKEAQDQICDMRDKQVDLMRTKFFQIHVFVTSVPKGDNSAAAIIPEPTDDTAFWGRPTLDNANVRRVQGPFLEMDLLQVMKNPPKGQVIQMGDVFIYGDRPDWNRHFQGVADRHKTDDVGVLFCGNPIIGDDLAACCKKFSSDTRKQFFRLHKENF